MTYRMYKARSHGQTHYFFCVNQKLDVVNRIAEYLENPAVLVEQCSWQEWDKVPRMLKHKLAY